jgi:retron-type reverse transcriptase
MAAMAKRCGPGRKLDRQYRSHRMPKKSGGTRLVSAPKPIVKYLQRGILKQVLGELVPHEAAKGFVPGESIQSNAAQHTQKRIVANCDIKNCFPSVRWSHVLWSLKRDLGERFSPAAISLLVDITTFQGGLPIGAPTSPAILNRVLHRTDELLSAAAAKRGCRYTRYADDLTFSGDDRSAVQMLGLARHTLTRIGLELDPKKTMVYRRGRRQVVTGLVVNDRVSVPRRVRRRLRAAVHARENGRVPTWQGRKMSDIALSGHLAHYAAVHPEQAAPLRKRFRVVTSNGG